MLENQHKRSLRCDAYRLKILDAFIGDLFLESIHMGTLQAYIEARREEGVKTHTINHGLQVVRHILNLAAGEWVDEYGLTWLVSAPKIKLLPEPDNRKPYPLNWDEQEQLFAVLPDYLKEMALFEFTSVRWWPETESNCRHEDFQSSALPTELSGQPSRLLNLLLAFKSSIFFRWYITRRFTASFTK
ncbi:MAG: hypothetical protein K0S11_1723 [Gammaproteobacteria bacterium]|nr:hypothetical protein [Gammaproteobacteria bacterium]